jgi:SAM-dependent methyltransferase
MRSAAAVPASGLVEAASAPYAAAGRFAYHFARGKLKGDPVFEAILAHGLLARREQILDLGCGQGLLAAWLAAARGSWHAGRWPDGWPEPPLAASIRGIELVDRYAQRARTALGRQAEFIVADVRRADFGRADAVVILDVLHYIEYADQQRILERVRRSLTSDGVLLLRIGDAGAGLGFLLTTWVDKMVMLGSGRGWGRLHCRSTAEWRELLSGAGFESKELPMSVGTPFANVLIIAKPR